MPHRLMRFANFTEILGWLGLLGFVAAVLPGCGMVSSSSATAPETPPIQVVKQPVNFAMRTFDSDAPPADMPPLHPGEVALCDSQFTANALLHAESHQLDAAHAVLTITGANVTLEAKITIWTPAGVTEGVLEHEQGHRQISEYYYKTADKLAQQIAETYVGRQVPIAGSDLPTQANQTLLGLAGAFTDQYGKQLNPDPAQQIFDNITDHSRNQMAVNDAVTVAIKDAEVAAPHPLADATN